MRILSLFDGISCARVALERAGIPVEEYYASEIDKYAIQISQKNWPDIFQLGDVKDVCDWFLLRPKTKSKIDVLIGGSPCQDLSIAKKDRKGLDGERSGLFWEYVRVLEEVKPKYFILENVNSMPKDAKDVITKTLGVEPVMINASLVSAQNRKRLFWTNIPKVNQPNDRGVLLKDILDEEVDEKYYVNISDRYGLKGLVGLNDKAKALTASCHKGYGNDGVSIVAVNPYSKSIIGDKARALNTTCGSPTTKNATVLFNQNTQKYRRLTPIECERLQSVPDNYTEGVSNTQRYKCLGNAFNADVVAHILSFIKQ